MDNSAIYEPNGAFLVEGIEEWIQTLLPIQEVNEKNEYDAIRMIDSKTGAMFAIVRLKGDQNV